jgi:hypothetical protein
MVNEEGKVPCVLVGEDGNAFAILGRVINALKRNGKDDKVAEFRAKATSSDYDNLLATAMDYCFNVSRKEMEKYEAHNCDSCNLVADCSDDCICCNCVKLNCWECDDRSDNFDDQFEEDGYDDENYEDDDPCENCTENGCDGCEHST